MLAVIIGLIIPLIATSKRYITASLFLWLGFASLLFIAPWERHTGWDFSGVFLFILTFPLYGIGFLSWLIGWSMRRRVKVERKKEDPPVIEAYGMGWKIYFWLLAIFSYCYMNTDPFYQEPNIRLVLYWVLTLICFIVLFGYVYGKITLPRTIALILFGVALLYELFHFVPELLMVLPDIQSPYAKYYLATFIGPILLKIPMFYGMYRYAIPKLHNS